MAYTRSTLGFIVIMSCAACSLAASNRSTAPAVAAAGPGSGSKVTLSSIPVLTATPKSVAAAQVEEPVSTAAAFPQRISGKLSTWLKKGDTTAGTDSAEFNKLSAAVKALEGAVGLPSLPTLPKQQPVAEPEPISLRNKAKATELSKPQPQPQQPLTNQDPEAGGSRLLSGADRTTKSPAATPVASARMQEKAEEEEKLNPEDVKQMLASLEATIKAFDSAGQDPMSNPEVVAVLAEAGDIVAEMEQQQQAEKAAQQGLKKGDAMLDSLPTGDGDATTEEAESVSKPGSTAAKRSTAKGNKKDAAATDDSPTEEDDSWVKLSADPEPAKKTKGPKALTLADAAKAADLTVRITAIPDLEEGDMEGEQDMEVQSLRGAAADLAAAAAAVDNLSGDDMQKMVSDLEGLVAAAEASAAAAAAK